MLALELRPDGAAAWMLDENATITETRTRALSPLLSPAQQWLELIETARDLCFSARLEPANLARIALVFPGALDANNLVRAGEFKGYDLKRGLREHLSTGEAELVVASESVADAWAQWHAGALRGCDNWLYLGLGQMLETVAMARGKWLQPDLGALILERDGPLDGDGQRGTWSAFCAGRSFEERARSYSLNVAPAQIWEMAPSNFAAQSLAEDYVSRLAQGLACGVAAFAPQRICIGGELGRTIFARIAMDLASELRDYLPPNAFVGDITLAAPGENIAPGVLALATLGQPPL